MGFVLIDFKKKEERAQLQKLGPDLVKKFDSWINDHKNDDATPPNEEEAKALEDAKVKELMVEFDTEAEKLWRVKEEHSKKRDQLMFVLDNRKGRLFRKYADTVGALKNQATDTMNYCVETFKDFEESMLEDVIPTTNENIDAKFDEFLDRTTQYVEETFPGGVTGLDSYDDGLPDGVPSYEKFKEQVASKRDEMKNVKNAEAVPRAIEKVKTNSQAMYKELINKAIEKAIEEIVVDLSNDTLPYLDEEAMQTLRDELIANAKEYGASRMD